MTTPTRPYREAKKRWIVKAIRKHQREIAYNVKHHSSTWNDVHYDFIGLLQAELDLRAAEVLSECHAGLLDLLSEPKVGPVGTAGDSGANAWPPPMQRPQPSDFAESKW